MLVYKINSFKTSSCLVSFWAIPSKTSRKYSWSLYSPQRSQDSTKSTIPSSHWTCASCFALFRTRKTSTLHLKIFIFKSLKKTIFLELSVNKEISLSIFLSLLRLFIKTWRKSFFRIQAAINPSIRIHSFRKN